MAGIYIPGMKMPQYYGDYDATFSVMPDGKVTVAWACKFCPTLDEFCGEVIPVPDHGRLGDLYALFKEVECGRDHHTHTDGIAMLHHRTEYNHFLRVISCAPTFLPADKEGEA